MNCEGAVVGGGGAADAGAARICGWWNPPPPGTGGACGGFRSGNPCGIGGAGRFACVPPVGAPGMNPEGAPYGTLLPPRASVGLAFSGATDDCCRAFAGVEPMATRGGGNDALGGAFCAVYVTFAWPIACERDIGNGGGARGGGGGGGVLNRSLCVPITAS